jgi:hypothetical protein
MQHYTNGMFPGQLHPRLHDQSLRKNKWTSEEDDQLRDAVRSFGTDSWSRVASLVPGRTGKQCRERWIDQISPTVIKDFWLAEEDEILTRTHAVTGNKWTVIAAQLPGRSALCVKNRWNWLVRHTSVGEEQQLPASSTGDVAESPKRYGIVFDPLQFDDGIFGSAFQQFRERMFNGRR